MEDNQVNDPAERQIIRGLSRPWRLHDRRRAHIWGGCYPGNRVRPVALSRFKVDVEIGNPTWVNFNQTADVLRTELQSRSRQRYGIWAGDATPPTKTWPTCSFPAALTCT